MFRESLKCWAPAVSVGKYESDDSRSSLFNAGYEIDLEKDVYLMAN